jgi:ABC-2 type transport system ATP-binding protein
MLEFHQVQKSFIQGDPILSIDNLILANSVYWLRGANGAGKTTLLRIIAGIVPFQGDILLLGQSQRRKPVAYRRLVGWADAEPLFPGFLTGQEIVSFYTGILLPDPDQVATLAQTLDIGAWLGTRLAAWSSGMTKKLALLLAFLGRPACITLDEPLITLDETGLRGLTGLISEYHYQYGTCFLLSSHQALPGDRLPSTKLLALENKSIQLIE